MPMHQYAQHDWPPALYALMLLTMAVIVVAGMCMFLLFATRPQQPRHAGGTHPDNAKAARSH